MKETHLIEYKLVLTDDLEKEAIAFLNCNEGGAILVGVDDYGTAHGLLNIDADMLKIKDRLKNNILPSCMGLFDVQTIDSKGKLIIKVTLASGSEKPYHLRKYGMTSKGTFIRIGTASEPMTQKLIEDLFIRRTRHSIGKIKSNKQDLTFEQLNIYYQSKGIVLNKQFAKNLELLTEDNKYNYVAYLMSDNNGTSIKVGKYDGTSRVLLIENPDYGYESLIKATKQVLDKMEFENRYNTQITSHERIDQRPWAPLALREAILNAFVHNDYSAEIPPKFEIFDDRIEITSTGSLPNGLNQNEFFEGFSVPRNKEIMRIFKDLGLVEQLGSGIPRILESYSKDCFNFTENFIRMIFPIKSLNNDQANDQPNDQVDDQANDQPNDQPSDQVGVEVVEEDPVNKPYDIVWKLQENDLESKKNREEKLKKYRVIAKELRIEQIKILNFADIPKSNKEIQEVALGLKKHNDNFKKYIEPLILIRALKRTIPDIPNSPVQKYITTNKGKLFIDIVEKRYIK